MPPKAPKTGVVAAKGQKSHAHAKAKPKPQPQVSAPTTNIASSAPNSSVSIEPPTSDGKKTNFKPPPKPDVGGVIKPPVSRNVNKKKIRKPSVAPADAHAPASPPYPPPPPPPISDFDDYDPAGFDEQDDIQRDGFFFADELDIQTEAEDLSSGSGRSFTPSEQALWDCVGCSIAYSETDLVSNPTFYDPSISYSELLAYIRSFKTRVEDVQLMDEVSYGTKTWDVGAVVSDYEKKNDGEMGKDQGKMLVQMHILRNARLEWKEMDRRGLNNDEDYEYVVLQDGN